MRVRNASAYPLLLPTLRPPLEVPPGGEVEWPEDAPLPAALVMVPERREPSPPFDADASTLEESPEPAADPAPPDPSEHAPRRRRRTRGDTST